MTIEKVIRLAGLIERGNVLPEELAIEFLSEFDGMIQSDIMLHAPEEIVRYDSTQQELLLRPPHDGLYVSFLVAMIRQCQGELEGYNNAQEIVQDKLKTFRRWYIHHYRPADTGDRSYTGGTSGGAFGFAYLSAYGLAVKQGYQGTEEEWLESLHGEKGDPGEAARMRYDAERDMIQWGVGEEWHDLYTMAQVLAPLYAKLEELTGRAETAAANAEAARGEAVTAANRAEENARRSDDAAQSANHSAAQAASALDDAETAAAYAGDRAKEAETAEQNAMRSYEETERMAAHAEDAKNAAETAAEAAKAAAEDAKNAAGSGVGGNGGGGGYVASDEPPENTKALWVDTSEPEEAVALGVTAVETDEGVDLYCTDELGTTKVSLRHGKDGAPGSTPVKGQDYFTEADVEEITGAVLAALPTWTGGAY